ncbi:hypothetical protein GHT06_018435 [Daphnia sinensis]|uniref:Peptidase A2 domain-containing protein n=1 Tax=Daphnia sinensis TaxID=1820382 RepID=A0AAD5L486_9CRUS|nr:hypothetical protein GHT06_018435 [Daphnia sinensis]
MATQDELRNADLIVAAPDAVIRGLSPTRSFASDSTSRLDPATLISKRSHHRRNFTRNVNKVTMVIHETGPSIYTNDLITKANDHYEQCMYYHHRYCAKLGVTDDTWMENLRHDYNTAHEEFATARRPGHDTEQPAPRATTHTRAQVHPGSVESTRQPESASRGVPTNTSHHSRGEDVSRTEVVVDPVSGSRHKAEGNRPSSLASSRSSVAASISSSHRSRSSTLSSLTRERLAAELDLELARKRREEEKNENDLLDELARKLREEKIRIGAKRKERKIEEEIARLRMNEKLSKGSVRSPSPTSLSSFSEPDDDIHMPLPKSKPRDKSADSWIDDLGQNPTALHAAAPMPWMFGGSAPFTCRTPFDGDPRDWLLFASRFRALVHDVIPNDAQRLAILTEWVGPSVFRRISPLLKAPRGYTAVLAYLKKHYGSSEQIARCQIHDLLSLPFVKPGDRQALESFSDQLHGAVVVLEQGGLEHDLKSAANLDQAVQKLPPVFRHRWARYARKRLPKGVDLSDLDRFMEEIVEEERMARSAFELAPKIDLREKRVTFSKPAFERHPSSRPAILKPPPVRPPPTILATQVAKDVDVECPGCGGAHRLVSCPELQRKSPSERALVAKEKGVCFNCLGGKHRSADCRSKPACESTGCRARHHSLLHGAERVFREKSTPRQFPSSVGGQECFQGPQTLAIAPRLTSDVLLAVVPVRLRAGCRTLDVFALLDTGSQATLLREDAANALGLTGRPRKIRFGTFHGKDPVVETRLVGFSVSSLEGDQSYKVSDAFVVPRLNVGQRKIKDVLASFDYLRDLNFPARDAGEVQVLIGMDVQDAHLNIEVRRPPTGVRGPNAVLTPFGWCVVGRTYPLPAVEDLSINFVKLGTIEQLEECVERFWKTQSLPVREAPGTFMSSLDRAAMDQLESTIRHTGTRYEVGLPVRPHCPKLPDNKEFARRKFFALERRLLLHNDLRQAVTAQMKEKLVELLKLGGFDLVQFLSSSRSLLDQLPSSSRLVPELDLDFDDLPTERTLGYLWSCERDEFVFRFEKTEEAVSKRSILSAISSIYDPLGLLAPVVLVAKIILQDIWRLKGGWDEILPADILNRWGRFVEHLPMLELLNIPRSFLTKPQSAYRSFQLHAFSDASKDGFGVVVYLRAETSGELSIPKMELQGALLAVRLANYLLKELTLPISNVFFWVDAMTIVRWIHASHRRYNVFVANRIAEILDATTPPQWRRVPGALNPADECSRGLCPSELDPNHRWYRGPDFLVLPPEQWPAQIPAAELIDHEDESIGCFLIANPSGPVDDVVARADNLHRLIRIAAWIERFVRNIQILVHRRRARERSILDGNHEEAATGHSEQLKTGRQQSADELKSARLLLIRVSQRDSFPDDLSSLRKAKSVRPESRLLKLAVYLDGAGIIRVGGRLENAPISAEARHPAVLEPKHPLTRLFIRWAHISVAHGRADRTLAEVRARYWDAKRQSRSSRLACIVPA